MSSRYEAVSDKQPYEIMKKLVQEQPQFGNLVNANIHIVYDTKKKVKGGKYVMASIQKTNDLTRYLSIDDYECPDGYDYILYLDKAVWDQISDRDKERLIFHELCHTFVDIEADNPFKVVPHEIEGFYAEVGFNEDDPKWDQRLGVIAQSVHSKED